MNAINQHPASSFHHGALLSKMMSRLLALFLLTFAAAPIAPLLLLRVPSAPVAQPKPTDTKGNDWGGKAAMVIVARDQATWEKAKQSAGELRMLPIGMPKGDDLKILDGVDFKKEMIVAVFWGEKNFSRHGEKCWIENVSVLKDEVVVECRRSLWAGPTDASYRAWPYHAKVVPRSEQPVNFRQKTDWIDAPARVEKAKTVATLKGAEWKQEFPANE